MTKNEAMKLLYVVKSVYPKHYENTSAAEIDKMAEAWAFVLEDYTYQEASAGLKAFLQADTKGFPPSPGQVVEMVQRIRYNPITEITAAEAWELVYNAVTSLSWESPEVEYNKLPETCRRAIGSAAALKEIAMMETDKVMIGEKARFIRQYDQIREHEKDFARLPGKVQEAIRIASKNEGDKYITQNERDCLPAG